MATTSTPREIPAGARILTGNEVLDVTHYVVKKWKPQSDMWSLNWGSCLLGGLAAASGLQINYYFRKRLRLKGVGLLSTFVPCLVFPFGYAYKLHQMVMHQYFRNCCDIWQIIVLIFVSCVFSPKQNQENLYLNPVQCIICFETNTSLKQLLCGLAVPVLITLPIASLTEPKHMFYRIPSMKEHRMEFFKFWLRLYKPYKTPLAIAAGLQVIASMFIVHMKMTQFSRVRYSIEDSFANANWWDGK